MAKKIRRLSNSELLNKLQQMEELGQQTSQYYQHLLAEAIKRGLRRTLDKQRHFEEFDPNHGKESLLNRIFGRRKNKKEEK